VGKHGIHIHEKSDFTNGCTTAGPHYNPMSVAHGGRGATPRHIGDMGSIEYVKDAAYPAVLTFTDDQIKLVGEYSVIDRAVVVHADADD
jgi:Cu-Zn family superoxide dismutase